MYLGESPQRQPIKPCWQPSTQFAGVQQFRGLRHCLLDTGSLTARLKRASGGDFQVQILSQGWGLPELSERRQLGMGDREWGIIREVTLICRGQPWVYARSILPARSLTGHLRRLRGLDSRPLGHILFTDPSLRRIPYQLCRYPASALPAAAQTEGQDWLWGRRSCFLLADKPIMVSEIFLPAFQPW